MKFANPMYLTKKVKQFVDDLINDYGYDSYDRLSYSDKCSFSALLIEAGGQNYEHEFICESKHLDQTINAFKKALLGNSIDDVNFLHTLKDNTINYFDDSMRAVYEHVQEDQWLDQESDSHSHHHYGAHL